MVTNGTPRVAPDARLSLTEAAARAGRCEATVREWIKARKLAAMKSPLTRRVSIRAADLDALLAADAPVAVRG